MGLIGGSKNAGAAAKGNTHPCQGDGTRTRPVTPALPESPNQSPTTSPKLRSSATFPRISPRLPTNLSGLFPSTRKMPNAQPAAPQQQKPDSPAKKLWDRLAEKTQRYLRKARELNAAGKLGQHTSIVSVDFRKNGVENPQQLDAARFFVNEPVSTGTNAATVACEYSWGKAPEAVPATNVQAAPSASFIEHEKYLVQGICSGQGVFQFVSEKKHFRPDQSEEQSITEELLAEWESKKKNNEKLILGGRYEVVDVITGGIVEPLKKSHKPNTEKAFRTATLQVRDLEEKDPAKKTFSTPITQVGLEFRNQCLKSPQIDRANQILERHQERCREMNPHIRPQEMKLPIIASVAGRGRGPTLITYCEIKKRIDSGVIEDKQSLEVALQEVVSAGRKARITADVLNGIHKPDSEGFVHSVEQLNQLKTALEMHLSNRLATLNHNGGLSLRTSTPAVKEAFSRDRFNVTTNNGGGNCLYHALYGVGSKFSLSTHESGDSINVGTVRKKIAAVLEGKTAAEIPDDTIDLELFYFKNRGYYKENARKLSGGKNVYEMQREGKSPREILVELQRTPGTFAGGIEIMQWLEINDGAMNNRNKTVVLIDAHNGDESTSVYRYGEYLRGDGPEKKRVVRIHTDKWSPPSVETEARFPHTKLSAKDIKDKIDDAIYGKLQDRQYEGEVPIIPENRIVIYRTTGHFERIQSAVNPPLLHTDIPVPTSANA